MKNIGQLASIYFSRNMPRRYQRRVFRFIQYMIPPYTLLSTITYFSSETNAEMAALEPEETDSSTR